MAERPVPELSNSPPSGGRCPFICKSPMTASPCSRVWTQAAQEFSPAAFGARLERSPECGPREDLRKSLCGGRTPEPGWFTGAHQCRGSPRLSASAPCSCAGSDQS